MSRKILDVKGVNKSFGGLKALNEVVFDAVEGETHAIIGPNGAGKSTFLNVCIGKLVPDTGTVMFDGQMMTGKQPHQINQAGIVRVFQTPEIFQDLTILQNVMISAFSKRDGEYRFNAFTSMRSEKNVQQEAESILKDLNMESMLHHHAKSLSRGDKRRLELAMSLIQKPNCFYLMNPLLECQELIQTARLNCSQRLSKEESPRLSSSMICMWFSVSQIVSPFLLRDM